MRIDLRACVNFLKEHDDYLILTHRSPDGDTLGSAFALHRAFMSVGKRSYVLCCDEIPKKYSFLWDGIENKPFEHKTIVTVDIADRKLLGEEFDALYGDKVDLCIDHHLVEKEYSKFTYLVDKSSNAENILDVIDKMKIPVDKGIADCIYCGIATDTGCFLFSNTTPETHIYAARMIECGADMQRINRAMFETRTKSYIALEKRAMDTIEFFYEGRVAIMVITQEMFRESHSNDGECDGIASLPRKIEGVIFGITMREREDGTYKVSVRTYPPYDAAAVCNQLGGGGHKGAAGYEFDSSLEEGKAQILKVLEGAL